MIVIDIWNLLKLDSLKKLCQCLTSVRLALFVDDVDHDNDNDNDNDNDEDVIIEWGW